MPNQTPLHIICGLPFEAACLARALAPDTFRVFLSGANRDRAREVSRDAAKSMPQGLMSFGIAGGLDPSVKPGTLLIPSEIVTQKEHCHRVCPQWHEAVTDAARARGLGVNTDRLLGMSDVVSSVGRKAELYTRHRAVAVDMESHGLAEAAQAHNVPFLVIRVLADPAHRRIPEAALNAIDANGKTHLAPIFQGIVKDPLLLGDLIRLSWDVARARAALRHAANQLLPVALNALGTF